MKDKSTTNGVTLSKNGSGEKNGKGGKNGNGTGARPASSPAPSKGAISSAPLPTPTIEITPAPMETSDSPLTQAIRDLNLPTGVGNNNNTLVDPAQESPVQHRQRSGSGGFKGLLKFRSKHKSGSGSESQKVPGGGGGGSASGSRETTPKGSPPDGNTSSSSKGLKGFFDNFRPRSKSDASAARANMLQRRRNTSGEHGGPPHVSPGSALSPIPSPDPMSVGGTPDFIGSPQRHRSTSWSARDRVQMNRDIAASLGASRAAAGMRLPALDRSSSLKSGHTGHGDHPTGKVFVYREPAVTTSNGGANSLESATFDKIKIEQIGEDDPLVYAKCMKAHTCYDAMPNSAKLIIFDTGLSVKKAFFALVYNCVRAAPLWDNKTQTYVGMLTISDFIYILQKYYKSPQDNMTELENHQIATWRAELTPVYGKRGMISTAPETSVFHAVRLLLDHKIHRLPIVETESGDLLTVLTLKRILKFIYSSMCLSQLPQPSYMNESLERLHLGTYHGLYTVQRTTKLIEALRLLVKTHVSALPVVNEDGLVEDIYSKFDVINLAADKTYTNLEIPISQAISYRRGGQERVYSCKKTDTLGSVISKLVSSEVHRLVIVNEEGCLVGVISLSDIFSFLVKDEHKDYENDESDAFDEMNGDDLFSADPIK